ncbi:MAG: DUF1015 family protein [Lachnospiraceae bacterium]
MAMIQAFRGIRPNPEVAAKVAALPYDVYDRAEARTEVELHPLSFLSIDRGETGLPVELDLYDPQVYEYAGKRLQELRNNGIFIKDESPCFYLYQLTRNGHSQTGIVACAAIDDYIKGVIKKHENTRLEKELDRIRHIEACHAQTGPIFLTYRQSETIEEVVSKVKEGVPVYHFQTTDEVTHQVWIIDNPEQMKQLHLEFSEISEIYIADGHHRAASAVKVGLQMRKNCQDFTGEEEFNYFLSVLFPSNELKILDYNRIISDRNNLSKEECLDRLKESFEIVPFGKQRFRPLHKHQIGMYLEQDWYQLNVKPFRFSSDPVKNLDVSILQTYVLNALFGIEDPKTDSRLSFLGGIHEAEELERQADAVDGVAFLMYPTEMDELFAVADLGRLMPPKSTWFEPKLRSGLFIHEI